MRMLICEPFKTVNPEQLPQKLSNDGLCNGLSLKNGLIANLTDIWDGFKYLRPFEMYDFSNLGSFIVGYQSDHQFAIFSSGDIYKIFCFNDLFSGNYKELLRLNKHSRHPDVHPTVKYEDEMICACLPVIAFWGYCISYSNQFILLDRKNNQYIKSIIPYPNSRILKIKRHTDGYILLLEKPNHQKIWVCLTVQGKVIFLEDELNREFLRSIENQNMAAMAHRFWFVGDLKVISPKIDYNLEAKAQYSFGNMQLWNISLYKSEQLLSEFGICIEKGKIDKLPKYIKGILEGNPIDNYLGTALNAHCYELLID